MESNKVLNIMQRQHEKVWSSDKVSYQCSVKDFDLHLGVASKSQNNANSMVPSLKMCRILTIGTFGKINCASIDRSLQIPEARKKKRKKEKEKT